MQFIEIIKSDPAVATVGGFAAAADQYRQCVRHPEAAA